MGQDADRARRAPSISPRETRTVFLARNTCHVCIAGDMQQPLPHQSVAVTRPFLPYMRAHMKSTFCPKQRYTPALLLPYCFYAFFRNNLATAW